MYLLIGHAWSIHTTRAAAPNPIPVGWSSVVWYHVTKQASKQWQARVQTAAPVGGLIYSVMEAANCDMALLRTVIPQMQ
jgi:hypothetical protein